MADIRRKSVKDFPRINNQRIHPDAYRVLNQIAGRRCLGAAIEDLCRMYLLQGAGKKPSAVSGGEPQRAAR
jgi:hypothetical protein